MFKIILLIAFLVITLASLTFICACIVGSRYEKRAVELQSSSEKTDYFSE